MIVVLSNISGKETFNRRQPETREATRGEKTLVTQVIMKLQRLDDRGINSRDAMVEGMTDYWTGGSMLVRDNNVIGNL